MRRDWRPRNSSTGAVCVTVASCYSLWALTWMQFVIGIVYGLPLAPVGHCEWALGYYQASAGDFPMNLPDLWVWLSAALALWAMASVYLFSRGKAGRWRMRFWVLLFSVIALGYAEFISNAEPRHVYTAQNRMWVYRVWNKEMVERDGGVAYRLMEYHRNRERSQSLLKVLAASGGVYDRTVGEATELMRRECGTHQDEVMTLLHKHVDFDPAEVGVIPWKEAVWDEKEEQWIYRVFVGETGYVEARLPNWSPESALIVVNTSDLVPWEEPLRWRR